MRTFCVQFVNLCFMGFTPDLIASATRSNTFPFACFDSFILLEWLSKRIPPVLYSTHISLVFTGVLKVLVGPDCLSELV